MSSERKLEGRKIVVLAASVQQVPLIRHLLALGADVITIDNRPDNPGHRLAARSHNIDIRSIDQILSAVRNERADGVIAAASDVAVEAASLVGDALGLIAPPPSAVTTLLSKAAFRTFQHTVGLPAPAWAFADEEPPAGPWIVKPVRGSGSRGIRLVAERENLNAALANAAIECLEGKAIVEQVIAGTQHTAEGWMQGGRVAAVMVTDRITAEPPHVATLGHRTPSSLSSSLHASIIAAMERIFTYLGYRDGPFDADIVVNNQGPTVIEASTRAGGNGLMQLVKAATGTNMLQLIALHAVGLLPEVRPWTVGSAAVQILASQQGGVLQYDRETLELLRQEPWIEDLTLDNAPGDIVPPFTDGRCRFGQLVISCRDGSDVKQRLSEVESRLNLQIETS